ncbi:Beta-ketoacyl-acyl-carrier-protein synthase I [Actinokineospora sp. UTMC 2448]|nr:Beta-ketoacyl-acyl-carrier-protein synthase I [Actinokineospora sp. UTMC 2448]
MVPSVPVGRADQRDEPIAIVGIGLRFPGGARTPAEFAEFLRDGRSGIRPVPDDRWDVAAFQAEPGVEKGRIQSPGGGFLDRIDEFDAGFFGISPKEAQYTDPQQRMLLETTWEALEDATIDPAAFRGGNGGVYVGAGSIDYAMELTTLPNEELDGHLAAGITFFPMSGRLSYFLDWHGPSMTIDTACASSLTALHQAVVGLRRGECEIAVCAGVNALHYPRTSVIFSHANMLAPDGQCKTFDDAANGYVRAEGCGALVLMRLSDAERDGATVVAVIRGSAVGQDGDGPGLSVPNGAAQVRVMRAALADAGLSPADISYVEAHGTGTPLGDPIEMGAISDVFAESHTPDAPIPVGSVKTNVGHLEPVAGIVGVVKAVLQIRDRMIYPHLNLTTPSGRIPWQRYPVTVPTECVPWTAERRRALVNSFGFAGTIAAAVIEEPAPVSARPAPVDGPHVFTLSAKSKRSLRNQVERYRAHLAERPGIDVGDLCYTAAVGRSHFRLRVGAVVADRAQLADFLDRQAEKLAGDAAGAAEIGKVAFLFSGQGTQYPGMGAALYRRYPRFRAAFDECDALFAQHLGRSVRAIAFGEVERPEELDQTLYTQSALFCLEYALAALWLSWGVRPSVLIGHSIGEVVAAAVAEVFSLPDAVRLVAARARLMQSVAAPGGMAAVRAPADDVAPLLSGHPDLAVAAVNSPTQCVISGGVAALDAVSADLADRGVEVTRLAVSHAFHSPLMAEVFDEFRAAIADIAFARPRLTVISNVTGKVARAAELRDPEYWVRHIAEPVRFAAGMAELQRRGPHVIVEVGPSAALTALAKRCVTAEDHRWAQSTDKADDGSTIQRALIQLYTAGAAIRWGQVHHGRECRRITLPTYGFDRRRHWLPVAAARTVAGADHPLLGTEVTTAEQAAQGVREFRSRLSPRCPDYLADHVIAGQVVFPGAGYVEMAFALQDAVYGETGATVSDLRISEPLFLAEDRETEVRTRLTERPDGTAALTISSRAAGDAVDRRHATAEITRPDEGGGTVAGLRAAAADAGEPDSVLTGEEVYPGFAAVGMAYGPHFQRLLSTARHGDFATADLRGCRQTGAEHLPPTILDGALHTLAGLIDDGATYLPVRFGGVRLLRKPRAERLRVLLRLRETAAEGVDLAADLVILQDDLPVAEVADLGLKRLADETGGRGRAFLHRPVWLKRSQRGPVIEQPRRVLAVGGRGDALAGHAAESAVEVVVAGDAAEAGALLRAEAFTDVCWFWRAQGGPTSEPGLRAECEDNYRDLLALLAVLDSAGFGGDQRLWLVTERAQVLPGDPVTDLSAAATLWGFGHSLLNERPGYRTTLIDLPEDGQAHLVDELRCRDGGEFQLAYRDGHRHVRRLLPLRPGRDGEENIALAVKDHGSFAGVRAVPAESVAPVGAEIQVRVHAAGLNFKDVLNALGMLKEHAESQGVEYRPLPLGFECSGTVVAAGPDAEFEVGAEVIVNYAGLMRRLATVPSSAAVRRPERISAVEGAGLASAYVTAHYALHGLAGIKAGDRVLIHAAAGGVGQAAVQLAMAAGAEVFATASPPKWDVLRAQGVRHLMNSRTLDFADEIMAATGGAGVDVILNSLNKDFIPAGLRALGRGGRFVELGKVGVWTTEEMAAARPDVRYHNFDLSELPEDEVVALNKRVLTEVADRIGAGGLAPITTTRYSLDEVEEAFGVLSRGANVGKLVIAFAEEPAPRPAPVRADRTYLITGGLGALGLVTASKLVELGARHLVLVGRQGIPRPDAAHLLDRLGPAEVTVCRGDVGDRADLRRIEAVLAGLPHPLGGIVHAAGGLADAPVSAQTWESVDTVFQSKVYGGWLLHEFAATRPELDFFVLYSSAASVVGGPGQANYAAANAFLDQLAHHRVRDGLPALSLNWGPVAQLGMSARLSEQHAKAFEDDGVAFFSPARAMRALEALLGGPVAQAAVGECDWNRFVSTKPITNALYQELTRDTAATAAGLDLDALRSAPDAERLAAIDRFIRAKVADVLHFTDLDDIDSRARFAQLGLDSLVAVELKNALEVAFGVPLPATVAFDHPTAHDLAGFLDGQITAAV